jgi:Flp pilus assembly protein TadB
MQITKFLPTPQKMSQETLATLAAIVISAWLVSRIPALKKLVAESNTQPY